MAFTRGIPSRFILVFGFSLAAVLFFAGNTSKALAFSGSGLGTSGSPYIITTCSQLEEVSNVPSADYTLGNDINCGSFGNFNPIATSTNFSGVLNGDGKTISNLTIVSTSSNYGGLFGRTSGALIEDFTVSNESVSGTQIYIGSLVAYEIAGTTINKVAISSSTLFGDNNSSGNFIGGFIGGISGNSAATTTIENSYAQATISDTYSYSRIGGFVGDYETAGIAQGAIQNAYFEGSLNGTGYQLIAGMFGQFNNYLNQTEKVAINNVFVSTTMVASGTPPGMIDNTYNANSPTFTNSFYDAKGISSSTMKCYPSGNYSGCNAVNTASNLNATYFENNSTNAPFPSWDFSKIWSVAAGYPVLQFLPQPTISLTTSTALSFAANTSSTATSSAVVTIGNTGDVSSTLDWSASSSQAWLTFSTASGSLAANTTTSIQLIVNPTGLAIGTYTGTATISDQNASNLSQTLAVTLTVTAPPVAVLKVTTSSFSSFNPIMAGASTTNSFFTISNTGIASTTLNWTATTTQPWVTFQVISGAVPGGSSALPLVTVDAGNLTNGTYNATATISDPAASSSPAIIPITMTVLGPILTYDASATPSFSATQGDTATSSQTFTISNTSVSSTTMFTTLASSASWLTFDHATSSMTGGSSTPFLFIANPTGLTAGTYNATATITGTFAAKSPGTVAVAYTIAPAASSGTSSPTVVDVAAGYAIAPIIPSTPITSATTTSTNVFASVSTSSLQTEINSLKGELHALEAKAGTTSSSFPYVFTRNLTIGLNGSDVEVLQQYLNTHGFSLVSTPTSPGSLGYETKYFGMATEKALSLFQKSVGITPPAGYFGPITRAYIEGHP